jgi:hypothetical protein
MRKVRSLTAVIVALGCILLGSTQTSRAAGSSRAARSRAHARSAQAAGAPSGTAPVAASPAVSSVAAAPKPADDSGAFYEPDCNDPGAPDRNCIHPAQSIVDWAHFAGYEYYIGHAEPTMEFFSNAGRSGTEMQWKFQLPTTDPGPTQNGSSIANFELYSTMWLGLELCDPNSNPGGACVAASDANDPNTAGAAFLELQFYPPGFNPSSTQWSVNLHINTLENFTNTQVNNCLEPTTAAFVTTDGTPVGPKLFMNTGDTIVVTITDTTNGLRTDVKDVTSSASGFMVASGANGYKHNANQTDCTTTAFDFHPMYATAAPGQTVPWAGLTPNVSADFEIGHWELCGDAACSTLPDGPDKDEKGSCSTTTKQGCFTNSDCPSGETCNLPCATVLGVGGCYGSDTDQDGVCYNANWPDGTGAHPTSFTFGSSDDKGLGPLTSPLASPGTYDVGYHTLTFKTTEGTGTPFYPFYSQTGTGTACRFNFGNDIPGTTLNDFGKAAQYGTTIDNPCLPGALPKLQIPGDLTFADTCVGSTTTTTLDVCNTGVDDLEVDAITSSDPQFSVATPTAGFPVIVSPDFCFPFQARYSPAVAGAGSTVYTVKTNDPVNTAATVNATGTGTVPRIATVIADNGSFGDVCRETFRDLPLTISNSGGCDLVVSGITTSSGDFEVPAPPSFPVVIGPGASLQVPIRDAPFSLGAHAATITVASNDPITTHKTVAVSGNTPPGDIRVTGSTAFGAVCGTQSAEKSISVCNVGPCNLNVSSVAFAPACPDFTLVNNPFPAPVSPDSCNDVVIRFTPTSCGAKSCTLVVHSDDPDTPAATLTVTANSPCADIDVPPAFGFPPTGLSSIGACTTTLPFPVSNTGTCPLSITAFGITTDPDEYSLTGLPSFPILLEPGHIAGEGDLGVTFAPDVLDRARLGNVRVTWVSDPVSGATTSVDRAVCGEGVRTGARVLVTAGGVPLASVEQIRLQRINANRNKNLLDTVDNVRNVTLQTVTPPAPCAPFRYHREYGTVSNPIQLAPGSYQVTVTAIVNGKRTKKSVGFDVSTCDFNPTIVVNF